MEIALIVLAIVIIGFFIVKNKEPKSKNLKELVKNTFPKYKIIEKHGTIMICEINHRNEPDELIFIRIEPNKKKNISQFGRRFKAEYPTMPTKKELKIDFDKYLN